MPDVKQQGSRTYSGIGIHTNFLSRLFHCFLYE